MLHANVGLTYLQTGGSPKPINESTSLTPLCNYTVLACPSFYTCEPAVSEWQIYKPCATFIFAPPTCTPHSQNAETFPSSFNFWDKDYRTPVIFFNDQSLKTRVHFKKKRCDIFMSFSMTDFCPFHSSVILATLILISKSMKNLRFTIKT